MNKLIVENLLEPVEYDYVQRTLDLFDKVSEGEEEYADTTIEERKQAIVEKVIREKELINEIAQHVSQTKMYKQTSKAKDSRYDHFMSHVNELSSKEDQAFRVYVHLMMKIADAPTRLHAMGSIVFIMPILNEVIS